ncbi:MULTISPECIES: metallopeptidase family protein [Peptoniphilus]|uniref:metallopeptidase family protein n=1 Tax=Peptoniphilus TaxID=162289 RepID=UPI0001DA9ECE|nr:MULTISPECIES: metallopeptidase family protein [Peptoniphilus]EFI41508.1 hypothetical protein HMPREF0629_00130 [Peptoniphilus sp. oral taxon 386 str. F0131]
MEDRLDEVENILNEIYDEIPQRMFKYLNGGIIIEENICYHPESKNDDLICLGAYKRSMLGNSIIIYYGSFMNMYGYLSHEELKEKLRETLHHELTHHLEWLAKENDLEIEDREFINRYKERE